MIVGCGDLTILLVGLGFHCFLLKCKEKLRHSLGRPSRSDFVQFEVVVFHSLRHLSTKYKLKMTHGDIKSVQGDTGHAEAEMVTDVYSEIVDEDRRLNAKKLDEEFYDTLDTEEPEHNLHSEAQEPISDNDKLLLELLKSMTPEMKEKLLKETLSNC